MINVKKLAGIWGSVVLSAGLVLGAGLAVPETGWAASSGVKAANSAIVLKMNGTLTSQRGIYQGGQVWVPLTFLKSVLGMPIAYSKEDSTYTVGQGTRQTKLMVSEYGIGLSVNGYYISEYEGKSINNHLYVPFGLLKDYLGYKGDFNASAGRLNIMNRKQNAITISTATYAKETEGYTIHLEYPQVSGLENAAAQQAINDTLKQTYDSFAAHVNTSLADRSNEDRPYEFDSYYVVTYNENGVLSLVLDQYEYLGGAHGMTVRQGFTFSLKDGKRLLLGDLFGANPNYKKQLNQHILKAFKQRGEYMGGFTGLQTEKYFYLRDGRVTLFFQLYDYTAYAAGFPEFTFAFKDLLPDGSSPFDRLK